MRAILLTGFAALSTLFGGWLASEGEVFGLWMIEELGRHGYKLSAGTMYPLRSFVIRLSQNHAEWIDVTTGTRANNLVEVFGNLHEGDVVAVRGTDQLRNGAEVTLHLVDQK